MVGAIICVKIKKEKYSPCKKLTALTNNHSSVLYRFCGFPFGRACNNEKPLASTQAFTFSYWLELSNCSTDIRV